MSESWRFRGGEHVGPWMLLAPLGRGGFSEVWRAGDGQREVALKLVVHPVQAEHLRREAAALSQVRGRGVVPVLAADLAHDPPWLALELQAGGSLRYPLGRHPRAKLVRAPGDEAELQARIRSALQAGRRDVALQHATALEQLRAERSGQPLPPPDSGDLVERLRLFEELLAVLERVHAEGIVHGDLKPENVLFDARGAVRVADFGLSRRISRETATLSVSLSLEDARIAGTLDYMAPEQRAGEPPTPRSDVYALGVVLYELLTRQRPQGRFALPGESNAAVPPIVDRLLACSLAADPRHRFASAGAMLAFLRAGLSEEWSRLARAHGRIEWLLHQGTAVQLLKGFPVMCGIVLVVSLLIGSQAEPPKPALVAGVLVGLGLTALLWRFVRPVMVARLEELLALRERIGKQIQTEAVWHQH